MKKFLNLLMIIYVILIFTACTSEITSNSYDRSNPHTDVEQINLKMLTSVMGVDPGAQTDNGFYEIAYTGETSVNILYTDFESKTRVFLCNRPECTHDTESCTSWIGDYTGGASLFSDGAYIYVLIWGNSTEYNQNETNCARILQIDLNGENRREIYRFKATDSVVGAFVSDSENLYFMMQRMNPSWSGYELCLVKLNTTTKELTPLETYKTGDVWIYGVSKENIIMKETDIFSVVSEPNSEQWLENIKNVKTKFILFPINGDEPRDILEWTQNDQLGLIANDHYYYIDYNERAFKAFDLYTAETKVIHTDLKTVPQENTNLSPIWDNHFLCEFVKVSSNSAKIKRDWLAIDLYTQQIYNDLLSYNDFGEQRRVTIIAESKEEFLVVNGKQEITIDFKLANGSVRSQNTITANYAFIAKDDFWSGVPNYQEIVDWAFPK